jgi:hypothetical protein
MDSPRIFLAIKSEAKTLILSLCASWVIFGDFSGFSVRFIVLSLGSVGLQWVGSAGDARWERGSLELFK